MNTLFIERAVTKYDCFYKDDVQDFSNIVDEMIEKYPDHKEYVFESIGISEKKVMEARFNRKQFRNALNFYLKEKAKCSRIL